MHMYKALFSFLGLIYLLIIGWALAWHLGGSLAIGVAGLLLCTICWFVTDKYL